VIRAVLFDLDDTLVPESAAWKSAFEIACADAGRRHGIDLESMRRAVFGSARTLWQASPVIEYCRRVGIGSPSSLLSDFPGEGDELAYLRGWAPEYRQQAWTSGLAEVGVSDRGVAEELSIAFKTRFAAIHEPFPDVEPALDELVGMPLGIVTNGASDLQRTKLEVSGLAPRFGVVLISSELGVGKPDQSVFELALERLGVEAGGCLMVGDNPDRDIAPADAIGMPTVFLDRSAGGADHEGNTLSTLEGLPRFLGIS